MRKITRDACEAFIRRKAFTRSNTCVIPTEAGAAMYLHGNLIASMGYSGVYIGTAGWVTSTTRERLSGICNTFGVGKVNIEHGDMFFTDNDGRKSIVQSLCYTQVEG